VIAGCFWLAVWHFHDTDFDQCNCLCCAWFMVQWVCLEVSQQPPRPCWPNLTC